LGAAIPLNGGAYAYLHRVYGPLLSFLFSSTMVFVLKPVAVAAVALIFGQYIMRVLFLALKPEDTTPVWAQKVAALVGLWLIIFLNGMGTQMGAKINTTFTLIKVGALGSIAIIGIAVLGLSFIN
jgi:amino acid transporter